MPKTGEKFHIDAREIHVDGVVTENGFTVFKGSEVRNHIAKYLAKGLVDMRETCMNDGSITEDWHLSRDIDFNSLSTAATLCSEPMHPVRRHGWMKMA